MNTERKKIIKNKKIITEKKKKEKNNARVIKKKKDKKTYAINFKLFFFLRIKSIFFLSINKNTLLI